MRPPKWGQVRNRYKSLKKWSDLMLINVTVTNSGKISPQEFIVNILVFTFASFNI